MKIFDLKLKRSFGESLLFYALYLLIGVLTTIMLSLIFGSFVDSNSYDFDINYLFGLEMGARFAVLISIFFPLSILLVKKIYNASFLLCLLGGALASIGGLLLGLIPSAIISTFYSRDEKEEINNNNNSVYKGNIKNNPVLSSDSSATPVDSSSLDDITNVVFIIVIVIVVLILMFSK